MKTVILGTPPPEIEAVIARRRALGQDTHDEIWQGEYHMAPAPHQWHAYLVAQLHVTLDPLAAAAGLVRLDALNLGDPANPVYRSTPHLARIRTQSQPPVARDQHCRLLV